jgi:hypothetical protein
LLILLSAVVFLSLLCARYAFYYMLTETPNTAYPHISQRIASHLQPYAILVSSSTTRALQCVLQEFSIFCFQVKILKVSFRCTMLTILIYALLQGLRFSYMSLFCMWFSIPDHAKHWILGSCFFPHSTPSHYITFPCCLVHDVLAGTVFVPFIT